MPDAIEGAVRVIEDLVVGKAKHGEARSSKEGVTLHVVVGRRKVVSAVSLDDKGGALAEKVDDVGSEWLLPSKLGPLHAAVAEQLP